MYVVLICIFLSIFWAATAFTQKPAPDPRQRYEDLHRKMIENLFYGTHDDKVFEDMEKLMEDSLKDFGMDMNSFTYSLGAQNFQSEWQESNSGRTLLITPQTKDQKLDINVEKEMVTVKGKSERKTRNGIVSSDFQNSFSIPEDCDSTKVKMDQKDGKIVMFFPWKVAKKIPLPKTDSDVTI
jgi:HSP20 family molecular chaperone IbpA